MIKKFKSFVYMKNIINNIIIKSFFPIKYQDPIMYPFTHYTNYHQHLIFFNCVLMDSGKSFANVGKLSVKRGIKYVIN